MPESLRLHTWGAASGIAFAVLVVVWGFLAQLPQAVDAPNHILDVYEDPGPRAQAVAATFVLALAAAGFLAFLGDLVRLLREAEGGDGALHTIALAGGIGFTVLMLVAGGLFSVLPNLILFDEVSGQVDSDLAAVVVQLGLIVLLSCALVPAGVMVLATSVIGLRTGLLPRWLGRSGFPVAALVIVGFAGPPLFLVLLWMILVCIVLRPRG